MMQRFKSICKRLAISLLNRTAAMWKNDELYLKLQFRLRTGYALNLKNPQTYNEKMQWLKLNDRKPFYTNLVDKLTVKEYVANTINPSVIIPTIDYWNNVNDIDPSTLPQQFVLKVTHSGGSNGVVICTDKNKLDWTQAKAKLQTAFKEDLYTKCREWPYKNVPKKVLLEPYIAEVAQFDYKVMCFHGEAKVIAFHSGRNTQNYHVIFYDTQWNKLQISLKTYTNTTGESYSKPSCLQEMIEYSEKLTKNMAHCRVDWYVANNHLYFGEITFYSGSGYLPFGHNEDDIILGSYIHL